MKSRMAGVLNLWFSIFKGFLLSAPVFRRSACCDLDRLWVCAGGWRNAFVCRRKATPKCAGADRAASAAAGTGVHNGTDNVIFRREPGFLFRSPGFLRFRRKQNEAYKRLLETAKLQAALTVPSRPAADHPVQLVSARGSVSVYAIRLQIEVQEFL